MIYHINNYKYFKIIVMVDFMLIKTRQIVYFNYFESVLRVLLSNK